MQNIRPKPVRQQRPRKCHISPDLNTCPLVFIRHDAVRKPLQPPYDGPFHVLKRHNEHYTLDILGKEKVISLDHLKPAYLDDTSTSDVTSKTDSSLQHPATTIEHP